MPLNLINALKYNSESIMNIKLAENFRAVFYAPFYATHALGLFAKEGLSISLQDSPSPGAGIAELAQGNIDVMWGGPLRVIKERDQHPRTGGSLVAFCEVAAKDPFFLVGKSDLSGFKLQDLLHLKFASVSEVPTPWLCLQEDLRDAGVDPHVISRISDKLMQENVRALMKGDIDVVQLFEPYVSQALEQGAGQILHAANARGFTAYTTFLSTVDGMQRNRDAFEAMIRAIEQFGPWLAQHGPGELARVVAPFYPNLAQSTLVSAMTRYQQAGLWTCRREISRAGFDRLGLSMYHSGYIGRKPDYEDCVAAIAYE